MNFFISETTHVAIKQIFESLRNSLVCSTIAVAGITINKYPKLSIIGIKFAPLLSAVIVWLAALLLLWNSLLTYYALRKYTNIKSPVFCLIDMPVFFIYIVLCKFQSKKGSLF